MPQPLSDGQITYSSGRSASVESASRDVVQFLAWASEPHMEYRKTIGLKVLFSCSSLPALPMPQNAAFGPMCINSP